MLKEHLLSRMQNMLGLNPDIQASNKNTGAYPIFLKGDRIYGHKIIQFNYTTYDVRRAQDVVNPGTSHCNIMLLAGGMAVQPSPGEPSDAMSGPQPHPYIYARVLRVYHANVVYTGPGMVDYSPTRMDFLWVRWFKRQILENPDHLDQLAFPPVTEEGAFGFVDPANVVRGCHIIPKFSLGMRYPSGVGFSRLADDSSDWLSYYIGR